MKQGATRWTCDMACAVVRTRFLSSERFTRSRINAANGLISAPFMAEMEVMISDMYSSRIM